MANYIRGIWGLRYFWMSLVRMDIRSRYRGSMIGMGWSLLHPIAMTVILTTVFSTLFGQSISYYGPLVMSGLTVWTFLQCCAMGGCNCFAQNEPYIRQVPAPLAIYPIRTMLSLGFHFCLALMLVMVLTCCVRKVPSFLAFLSLAPSLVLLALFGWSLALLFGLAKVRFRDTTHLAEVGLQALYFLTPIIYEADVLIKKGLGFVIWMNPIVPFLNLIRTPVMLGTPPTLTNYAVALAVTVGFLVFSGWILKREERQLIFHL